MLSDGKRLHLHHGPIDLILGWSGPGRTQAFVRATHRFEHLLRDLAQVLPALRQPVAAQPFDDPVAERMRSATMALRADFITPMAAVAGSVADEVLTAMTPARDTYWAYVNNGGDIAAHIRPDATLRLAIASAAGGGITLSGKSPVRGIATSGWGGRSHSMGIADAVTVLARSAALADAAATLIANHVDLPGHPAIARQPAQLLAPDSDLGHRLVTTSVDPLAEVEIRTALAAGADYADTLAARGLIDAAYLEVQGHTQIVPAIKDTDGCLDGNPPIATQGYRHRVGGEISFDARGTTGSAPG